MAPMAEFERTVLTELAGLKATQAQTSNTLTRMESYFDKIFDRLDQTVKRGECAEFRKEELENLECELSRLRNTNSNGRSGSKIVWWALGVMASLLITSLSLLYHELSIIRSMAQAIK